MEKKKIKFSIKNISTESFTVDGMHYVPGNPVGFNLKVNFKASQPQKIVGVFLTCTFTQNEKVFLTLTVSSRYELPKESWKVFPTSAAENLILSKEFATHLSSLTVGTLRGVLHTKTENTIFSKIILPPVNVTKLVKADLIFKQQS